MVKINSNVMRMASIGLAAVIGIGMLLVAFTQIEETQWEKMETFPSDKYGHYQTWCESNQGAWFENTIECKFEYEKDHTNAMLDLNYIQNEKYTMPEKYVLPMCHLLEITCIDGLQFQGYFDFYTNYLTYDYDSNKVDFSFRLMDDVLEYKGKKLVDGEWIGSDENWVKLGLPLPPYVPETSIVLDKQNYELGDSIKISGLAYDYRNDHIIVNLFDPNFQLMDAAKIQVDSLGRFSHSFDSYSSWKLGMYKMQIYDGEIKFEHSFEIISRS